MSYVSDVLKQKVQATIHTEEHYHTTAHLYAGFPQEAMRAWSLYHYDATYRAK